MHRSRILLLALIAFAGCTQSQTLNGVYVGAQLYTTPFEGMQVNHLTYYFRNDGSFTDHLNKANWKTDVAGNYSVKQNTIQLSFKDGREAVRYQLAANGNLESTVGIKHTLHKVKKVNSLPPGTYVRKTASSQGGMGTGMPNIGTASTDEFSIDGKGHFSFEHEGVVGVTGNGVAGKFGNDDQASGNYILGDGEITLNYRNGKTSKVAFFYSPANEEDLIVLNGDLYFREKKPTTSTAAREITAEDLLQKLRSKYGGESIDKITTLKETATVQGGFQLIMYTDLINNKIRTELRQNNTLLSVEQLEGNEGWQWVKGSKKQMPEKDKNEFRSTGYLGVIGLHKKLNKPFSGASISKKGEDFMITFNVNQVKVVYMVGADYVIKGNAWSAGEAPKIAVYKVFSQKNGIRYPVTTEFRDEHNTVTTMQTTALEINPVIAPEVWKIP